jgi:DNA-directed RNA polymerase specialized sigma subunit
VKEKLIKEKIKEFTPFIRRTARVMADGEWDWEDFIQEGNIALWQALEFDRNATKTFIHQRIRWRMLDHARRIYPNKEVGFSPQHENLLYGNAEFDTWD